MSDEPAGKRPRKAVGADRPRYFDDTDIDRVMAILLALISEVASIRERLDAHERIATEEAVPSFARVEAHVPDAATEAAREQWRKGYIHRLFRVITEDVDAIRAAAPAPDNTDPAG